jgi:CMP-N,N'-diacetyllegionaminic acid synthase
MNIITICARGGSSGLPGKNIKPLCGKPLIGWTIEQAIASGVCPPGRVYVSTDSPDIADVAKAFGATVGFLRPAELATASAAKVPVIQHLVQWVEGQFDTPTIDAVIDLDPTSPLRDVQDIRDCLGLLQGDTDAVITGYNAEKNPYFNMVELKANGGYERVCKPVTESLGRQSAPTVYSMNASIYVWRRRALRTSLWDAGKIALHTMPRERSIDIDHPIDFDLVTLLMQRKLDSTRSHA